MALRALVAHIFKVLLRLGGSSKVDLPSLIEQSYLVEDIISILGSLVDGDAGCGARVLAHECQVPAEFECIGTIQTPGTIVPTLQGTLTESSLCNTNTLPLTSTDSTDKVISHPRVDGVGKTKHGHHHVSHMLCVLLVAHPLETISGGSGKGCKHECIPDGELGEVDVSFSCIDCLAFEVLLHFF